MDSLSKDVPAPGQGKVLLTGADGFTGRYVRAELEQAGYTVIATGSHMAPGPHQQTLDITSLEDCRRVIESAQPDFLIHLAAISFVQHADAAAFYRVNVIGTTNLLQATVDAGVRPRSVILASSANVYGNAASGVIGESQPPQPVNHYATSKIAMEYMARTWDDRLPITITRPFNYTGVGQPAQFLVPKIVSHFARRAPLIELGNLDVERDFSDVRTVAHVYRRLLEKDCAGETINICSGRAYSLHRIIEILQELAGYEIEVRVNPAFVRQSEVKVLIGSTARLHQLLGDIKGPALEETLRWMLAG